MGGEKSVLLSIHTSVDLRIPSYKLNTKSRERSCVWGVKGRSEGGERGGLEGELGGERAVLL